MRPARHRYAALLLGSGLTACAVYTDEALKPLGNDVASGGTTDGTAGNGAAGNLGGSGGAASQAGGKANAGSAAISAGRGGSDAEGGAPPSAAGVGNESGGELAGGEGSGGEPAEPAPGGSGGGGSGTGGMAGATSGGTTSGGSAGTGGKPPTGPSCDDHPLTARSSWALSSNPDYATGPATYLVDNKTTRWTTGKAQSGDEWLQIDFGQVVTLSQINLQQGEANANDYPRGFTITVSNTPTNLSAAPSFSGMGKSGVSTTILLPAFATGRYLLLEQTGTSLSWWSAVELEVSCVDPD